MKPDKSALYTEFILEPRQRRLASLNAEAVNSLLLDRGDPQQTSKPSKKQQQTKGDTSLAKDTTKDNDCSRKGQDNRKRTCTGETKQCRNPKKAKTESDAIDLQTLNSPAPKRLAGLNAAALLKLTSTSSEVKRRSKTDGKSSGGAVRGKQLQLKSRKQQHNLACQSKLKYRSNAAASARSKPFTLRHCGTGAQEAMALLAPDISADPCSAIPSSL